MKVCLLWEAPYSGIREEHEEERVTVIEHYRLTMAPNSSSPCTTHDLRVKENLGRREVEGVISFVLISHYPPMLQLIGNTLIFPNHICLADDSNS